VKSKDRFMAAYSAGRSAYQNHAMDDMEPWEVWACVALLAVVTSSSKILLERDTSLPWMGRQGISECCLGAGLGRYLRNSKQAARS
jgi:hypothetical protein